MGQAQLLLIVLGVVLVGIAIVAGIQAYSVNNANASVDAQVHDLLRVASDVQTYVQQPPQFGGPAVYGDFTGIDFSTLNYRNTDGTMAAATWQNVNALYTTGAVTAGSIAFTGANADLGTSTAVHVCGLNDNDILIETSADPAVVAAPPACPA